MPLYVADYLADTAHLGALESGVYLHLIMHYWLKGGLPDDADYLPSSPPSLVAVGHISELTKSLKSQEKYRKNVVMQWHKGRTVLVQMNLQM